MKAANISNVPWLDLNYRQNAAYKIKCLNNTFNTKHHDSV